MSCCTTAPSAPSYHPLASPFLSSLGLTLPIIRCRYDLAVGKHERGDLGGALELYEAAAALNGADEKLAANLARCREELSRRGLLV